MSFADSASGRVRSAFRRALNSIGRMIVADIRESLSVRVEYFGNTAIRSEPGEPPRYEFGSLWKSIKYRVAPKAVTIEQLEVYTTRPQAYYLEVGFIHSWTGELVEPRPFWAPAKKRSFQYTGQLKSLVGEYLRDSGTFDFYTGE